MKLLFDVYDSVELLPWFLDYYWRMGITEFFCCIHKGYKNALWPQLASFATKYPLYPCPLAPQMIDGDWTSAEQAECLNRMRRSIVGHNEIYCIADMDEFVIVPGYDTLPKVAEKMEQEHADILMCYLLDRVTADGTMPPLLEGVSLDTQFPFNCDLTERVAHGNTNKLVLSRGSLVVPSGHHFGFGKPIRLFGYVHHFKWHAGTLARLRRRAANPFEREHIKGEAESLLARVNTGGIMDFTGLPVVAAHKIGI